MRERCLKAGYLVTGKARKDRVKSRKLREIKCVTGSVACSQASYLLHIFRAFSVLHSSWLWIFLLKIWAPTGPYLYFLSSCVYFCVSLDLEWKVTESERDWKSRSQGKPRKVREKGNKFLLGTLKFSIRYVLGWKLSFLTQHCSLMWQGTEHNQRVIYYENSRSEFST